MDGSRGVEPRERNARGATSTLAAWAGRLERRQVPIYLAAIAVGAVLGALLPRAAGAMETAVEPSIAALLLVTFLGVPLTRFRVSVADGRFLAALLVLNFVVVPVVVWAITRPLAASPALLIGALLVLLAPCIDYVIVFTALAGGDRERLLAATPVLMLAQMLALPVLVPLLGGGASGVADLIDVGPFIRALVLLILLPLAAAMLIQRVAPRWDLSATMVPLMVLVLVTAVGSQVPLIRTGGVQLLALVPVYAAFLVLATAAGLLLSRVARLEVRAARALTFSGATRNSLVVLPLALAMPAQLALVPAAVVTQTVVELVGMVVLVRVLPRLLKG
ncbi:bile acid:sodium symporter [Brachybacterium sp. GCM10030267]|uniref:bile acid:sodium symporter n=1 Tax=unclassified Brachybacterium TaxID=2623841 RepID=UPI00361FE237